MDFDFDFEPEVIVSSIIIYAVVFAGLWFIKIGDGWSLWNKIVISLILLPVTYFICKMINER